MIDYIKGSIVELNPASATIETRDGIGYQLNISLNTFSSLQSDDRNSDLKLYVHENIREDAWVLYGFSTLEERALFRLLLGVSGVGASTARVILSAMTVPELESIIANGDTKTLKQVKGIGSKTAERIIVDLRDKIKPGNVTLINMSINKAGAQNQSYEDALTALVNLGFPRSASQKALDKLFKADPGVSTETAIKKAFSML